MRIEKIVVGELRENCYLIIKNNNCLIVDPGDEVNRIINVIEENKLIPKAILITHAHFDHIGALAFLHEKYNINIWHNNINDELIYKNIIIPKEEKYEIDNFKFEVIYTPGHRNDLVTYYFYENNLMFTGDFLFRGTIGRTDLEYSNYIDMLKSINKIKKYNDNIAIYPGHGEKTILGEEKKNNKYFN